MNPPFNFPATGEFTFPPTFIPQSAQEPSYSQQPPFPPPHPDQYPQPHSQYLPYPQDYTNIDPLLGPPSLPPPALIPEAAPSPSTGLRIKLPPMAPTTRGSARQYQSSVSPVASGSEYHESNASMEDVNPKPEEEEPEEEPPEYAVTSRGRRITKKSYKESESEGDPLDIISPKGKGKQAVPDDEDEDEEAEHTGRYALRTRSRGHSNKLNGFIVSDEEDGEAKVGRYPTRNRSRAAANGHANGGGRNTRRSNGRSQPQASSSRSTRNRLSTRRTRSSARNADEDDGYVDEPSSGSADGEGSMDEAPVTSPEPEPDADADGEADAEGDADPEPDNDGKPYALRQRAKINYAIPPPLEEMRPPPPKPRANRSHRSNRPKPPGWSATGAELSRWMGGGGGDDSVSTRPCLFVASLNSVLGF